MRDLLRRLLPDALRRPIRRTRLVMKARELSRALARTEAPDRWFSLLSASEDFRPLQNRREFVGFLERLMPLQPRRVCEIGAAAGGTAILLARAASPGGDVIIVDIGFDAARRAGIRAAARRGQRVWCVRGDSHRAAVRDRVRDLTGPGQLDVVFIDGDHDYDGVAADFAAYAPLVREGGLVALHDIVPDRRTRGGWPSRSSVGGVPRLWAELRARFGAATEELIDDPSQDGCGIGLIRWSAGSR